MSSLFERLSGSSELLNEAIVLPRVELNGNRDAIVDGCKGVLEYDCGVVRLNCGKLSVRFCGTNLSIKNLTFDKLVVSGDILTVDFSC